MTGPAADPRALDVEIMRDAAVRVRQLGGPPPLGEDLDVLVRTMKGHIHLLTTEIRVRASRLPAEAGPVRRALAGVAEAERRLRAIPRLFDTSEARYARALKFALSIESLCGHHENLTRRPVP